MLHQFDSMTAHHQPIASEDSVPPEVKTSSSIDEQNTLTPQVKSFMHEMEECFKLGEGRVNPDEIKQIFRKYSDKIDIKDFEPFCLADTSMTYTRNLVMNNPYFSLIALVWNPRQHSTIHAHGGSQCWFRVLRGQVKECRWLVDPKHDTQLSPTNPTKEFVANEGAIGYIDDNNGVHCIVNTSDSISVSLHCYAPPYQECECYSESSGEVFKGKMVFDSVGGVPFHSSETMYNFLKEEQQ